MILRINKILKDKIAVGLGSALDWYDFALYGFFASTFAKQFFPHNDYRISLLSAFAAWFIGFTAKPLGALIFGHIGDKYGRVICFRITSVLNITPCNIHVERKNFINLTIEKDQCQTHTTAMIPTLAAAGVVLGGLVDYGTGAVYDLQPNPMDVNLVCNRS